MAPTLYLVLTSPVDMAKRRWPRQTGKHVPKPHGDPRREPRQLTIYDDPGAVAKLSPPLPDSVARALAMTAGAPYCRAVWCDAPADKLGWCPEHAVVELNEFRRQLDRTSRTPRRRPRLIR